MRMQFLSIKNLIHQKIKTRSAFTLLEILVVITLVSIIAAFSIPNFTKSMEKSYESEAVAQLKILHSANRRYYAENDTFYASSANTIALINTNFSVNLSSDGNLTYTYTYTSNTNWIFTAAYKTDVWSLLITNDPVDSSNPCCDADVGECPSLPDCA